MPLRVLLLLLFNVPVLAQELSYQVIGKAQGAPSNTIYDLTQDRRGFIWVATNKGLFRYDGVNFRLYSNNRQTDNALSNLMEDSQGRMWCQSFTGQFFYIQADSLHYCPILQPTGTYFPGAMIGSTLMSIGKEGIRRLDLRTSTLAITRLGTVRLRPFAQVSGGYYYMHDDATNRLLGVSADGKRVSVAAASSHLTFYHAVIGETLFQVAKLEATRVEGRRRNGQTFVIRLARKSLIQHIKVIEDRYLCLFTSAGFYLIDVALDPRLVIPLLPNKNCTSMIKDREGNFWLSTINGGLLLIPSLSVNVLAPGKPFTRLQMLPSEKRLAYGTAEGELGLLRLATGTWQPLLKSTSRAEVLALFYDEPRRQLFFSTDRFYRFGPGLTSLNQMSVKDIEPLNDQMLGLAATGMTGLCSMGSKAGIRVLGNRGERVRAVAVIPGYPQLYAASATGLWRYDTGQPGTLLTSPKTTRSFTDLTVLTRPGDPVLFAASPNQGLFAFRKDRQVLHLTTANGLADNSLYRVKAYRNQVWWLAEKAVQCYDLTTRQVRTYDQTDGLPDADLTDLAFARDTVYVATLTGLVRFPANLPSVNTNRPVVLLTGLFRNRQPVNTPDNPVFRHDENTIDIRYALLSYRSQGRARLFYRINGKNWLRADQSQRILSLPSLAPDSYVIELKARNEDGVEGLAPVTVHFTINQPVWLQTWFLSLAGLLCLVALYGLYRYRLARQARVAALDQERVLLVQELQQSRLTAIKSQMNPHFLFNALNTIQSYIYLNEKQQASTYLVKFSDLTRMILDMSGGDTVTLEQELRAIGLYLELEQMRFEDTLTYTLTVADSIHSDEVRIPSMLIQPYVENAIKHGLMHKKSARHLTVDFRVEGRCLRVAIEDNGVGRHRAAEINYHRARRHEPFALEANQKRLELLNDGEQAQIGLDIIDKHSPDGAALGTLVLLRIPI